MPHTCFAICCRWAHISSLSVLVKSRIFLPANEFSTARCSLLTKFREVNILLINFTAIGCDEVVDTFWFFMCFVVFGYSAHHPAFKGVVVAFGCIIFFLFVHVQVLNSCLCSLLAIVGTQLGVFALF